MPDTIALIVAAGRGRRFGGSFPKQYAPLAGKLVLAHTLEIFAGHPQVAGVRVVIHPDDCDLYEQAADGLDLLDPVGGGDSRQESVRNGLESLVEVSPGKVLIHDGARPFASADLVGRVIEALDHAPGALAAIPVTDTLKREADGGRVGETVPRDGLWRAQTPQGFRFDQILAAHRAAAGAELTDDAAVAELAGLAVSLVEDTADNEKITTQEDLMRAESRIAQATLETRFGQGFDVHKFGPEGSGGGQVQLCGIAVPHERPLLGHSDADVGLHAITDALLGALAAGDIGDHFPPSDPRWKGAASHLFLEHARDLVLQRGGRILNVDLTLICERPKIGPHREAMATRVAEILDIAPARVSIKATTTEGLGFTGRREGIAAQAGAAISIPA